ncbi:HD domain-containing protein [Actinomadura sp. 7K534]|uniref:HD domain-containing protein n=1 Tax=Actinomadura sp. 7K534 TaxID=2530366 RepID=UPI001052AC71|nr:HD domain-containing protein [Actinomadura sp. 7K534]TDB94930.1 HD domain-containing protein [Actinomadura sp. 7K534]
MASETERLAGFLYEIGLLKRYKRTGWFVAGVQGPESIADHSFRAAIIASVLAAMEGADPERAALLSLFHDSQETRLTDLPYLARAYVKKASNEEVTEHQTRGLPDVVTAMITGVVAEYEGKVGAEAMCARDADKLECLIQAVEYREHGNRNTQPWIDSSLAQLQTASAKRLAAEVQKGGSLDWFTRVLNGDEGP